MDTRTVVNFVGAGLVPARDVPAGRHKACPYSQTMKTKTAGLCGDFLFFVSNIIFV